MKPNFRMKNMCVYNLMEFHKGEFIYKLSNYYQTNDDGEKESLLRKISFFIDEYIPPMVDEINQTIYTSNDQTKIALFEELKDDISSNNLLNVSKSKILFIIEEWNREHSKKFEEEQVEKENSFIQNEVKGRIHLKNYVVDDVFQALLNNWKGPMPKRTITHYHYRCIDDMAKLIDVQFVDRIIKTVEYPTSKFSEVIDPFLKKYEAGKYTSGKNKPEDPLLDKWMRKLKNNWIVAVIVIATVCFSWLVSILKDAKVAKESMDVFTAKDSTDIKPTQIITNTIKKSDISTHSTSDTLKKKIRDTIGK